MRLFISVEISDELKDKIADIQKRFRDIDINLVEKGNLHFCLKFLGEVADDKLEEIKKVMTKVGEQFEPFTIHITGIGAFPNKNYVKVLFLDVKEGREAMKAIASMLGPSDKPFVPHLTLGRIRSGKGKEKLQELIKELENVEIGKMEVGEIRLIKSELTPSGPLYEEIFTTKLGS